jgi:hypothetical protein
VLQFGDFEQRRLRTQIDQLQREKRQLHDFVDRLCSSRKVAQIEVLDQHVDRSGQTVNVLQWQEVADDGTLGRPLVIEALGRQVYFEGLVIQFDYDHIRAADQQRERSVVVFRRVFGEQQAAQSARSFDSYELLADVAEGTLHSQLWQRFWDLVEDPVLRERYGVRIAQCEAPAARLRKGQVWELELAAAGGLNLTKLSDAPHFVLRGS